MRTIFAPTWMFPEIGGRADGLLDAIVGELGPEAAKRKDAVKEAVIEAAIYYAMVTAAAAESGGKVRVSDVRRRLTHVGDLAKKLTAALDSLDPVSVAALHRPALWRKLLARGGARRARQARLGIGSLSEILRELSETVPDGISSALPLPSEKQEATLLRPNRPKYQLVAACLAIFDTFRRGQATSTEGCPFKVFVELVYEVATGENASDKKAALEKPIKEVLRDWKFGSIKLSD